jgi:hypothetical protein
MVRSFWIRAIDCSDNYWIDIMNKKCDICQNHNLASALYNIRLSDDKTDSYDANDLKNQREYIATSKTMDDRLFIKCQNDSVSNLVLHFCIDFIRRGGCHHDIITKDYKKRTVINDRAQDREHMFHRGTIYVRAAMERLNEVHEILCGVDSFIIHKPLPVTDSEEAALVMILEYCKKKEAEADDWILTKRKMEYRSDINRQKAGKMAYKTMCDLAKIKAAI